jgi:hypothetical protein
MLVASLIVGLLGVWYLGLRAGMYAAGITAALLLLAMVAPQLRLYCYGALIVGVVGMGLISKKVATKATPRSATAWAKQRAWRYLRRR